MIQAILFDLDGTLLPMEQEKFTRTYFSLIADTYAHLPFEREVFLKALWNSTMAMIAGDNGARNDEVFWRAFEAELGPEAMELKETMEQFYTNEFHGARVNTSPNPAAAPLVRQLREKGFTVALTTNPMFPLVGVETRLSWIDLTVQDFDLVTHYQNCHYCKPNPAYFTEVAGILNVKPQNCLVVGNDVQEDGCALRAGMDLYLITDCLENRAEKNYDTIKHGNFAQAEAYLQGLPVPTAK